MPWWGWPTPSVTAFSYQESVLRATMKGEYICWMSACGERREPRVSKFPCTYEKPVTRQLVVMEGYALPPKTKIVMLHGR